MRSLEWEVQIYESKAIYNARSGTYTANPGLKTGNADCQGIMPSGVSVAVEFKAPGKLNSFQNPNYSGMIWYSFSAK